MFAHEKARRDIVGEYKRIIVESERLVVCKRFSPHVLEVMHVVYDYFGRDNMGRQFCDTVYAHHYKQLVRMYWVTVQNIQDNAFLSWTAFWVEITFIKRTQFAGGISDKPFEHEK